MLAAAIDTAYRHIHLNEKNVPVIADTGMKVIELVLSHLSYGWSPEELYFQYPYLTLGQIHSALAYYNDHQSAFQKQIEQQLHTVEQLRQTLQTSRLPQKLHTQGLL